MEIMLSWRDGDHRAFWLALLVIALAGYLKVLSANGRDPQTPERLEYRLHKYMST